MKDNSVRMLDWKSAELVMLRVLTTEVISANKSGGCFGGVPCFPLCFWFDSLLLVLYIRFLFILWKIKHARDYHDLA